MKKGTYIADGEHATHLGREHSSYWAVCNWQAAKHVTGGSVYDFWCDHSTSDLSLVTCHACLDEVVRRGEAAARRVVQLERDAGDEASGGTCPHRTAFQCTWCDETFCLDDVIDAGTGKRRVCEALLHGEREIKTVARQCRNCYQIERDIEEREHPADPNGCMVLLNSAGLAAFSDEHKTYWENKRAARLKLRAALGRLGPAFAQPVVRVPSDRSALERALKGLGASAPLFIIAIANAAIAFVRAPHTGDANCRAGDCDDCPARDAEQRLREVVAARLGSA